MTEKSMQDAMAVSWTTPSSSLSKMVAWTLNKTILTSALKTSVTHLGSVKSFSLYSLSLSLFCFFANKILNSDFSFSKNFDVAEEC